MKAVELGQLRTQRKSIISIFASWRIRRTPLVAGTVKSRSNGFQGIFSVIGGILLELTEEIKENWLKGLGISICYSHYSACPLERCLTVYSFLFIISRLNQCQQSELSIQFVLSTDCLW